MPVLARPVQRCVAAGKLPPTEARHPLLALVVHNLRGAHLAVKLMGAQLAHRLVNYLQETDHGRKVPLLRSVAQLLQERASA